MTPIEFVCTLQSNHRAAMDAVNAELLAVRNERDMLAQVSIQHARQRDEAIGQRDAAVRMRDYWMSERDSFATAYGIGNSEIETLTEERDAAMRISDDWRAEAEAWRLKTTEAATEPERRANVLREQLTRTEDALERCQDKYATAATTLNRVAIAMRADD